MKAHILRVSSDKDDGRPYDQHEGEDPEDRPGLAPSHPNEKRSGKKRHADFGDPRSQVGDRDGPAPSADEPSGNDHHDDQGTHQGVAHHDQTAAQQKKLPELLNLAQKEIAGAGHHGADDYKPPATVAIE